MHILFVSLGGTIYADCNRPYDTMLQPRIVSCGEVLKATKDAFQKRFVYAIALVCFSCVHLSFAEAHAAE